MLRSFHVDAERWAILRRHMIQETEMFLEDGLLHPERHVVIPARKVGTGGGWSPMFASVFWSQVLATS